MLCERPCLRAACVRCVCAVHAHCARGFGMCVYAAIRTRCSRVHCSSSCALLCVRIVLVRTILYVCHACALLGVLLVRVHCAACTLLACIQLCVSMCVRCACNVDPDHTGTLVCQRNIFPLISYDPSRTPPSSFDYLCSWIQMNPLTYLSDGLRSNPSLRS
jgi:hypothetical protein